MANPQMMGAATAPATYPDVFEVTSPYLPIDPARPDPVRLAWFRDAFRASSNWYEGEDDDPYVTYIVVRDRNPPGSAAAAPSEADMLGAAELAFLSMLSTGSDNEVVRRRVSAWCSSRIRKVVKRARGAKWERVVSRAMAGYLSPEAPRVGTALIDPETALYGAVVVDMYGPTGAAALCMAPMRVSNLPEEMRRLQVSGLSLERAAGPSHEAGPILRIVVDASQGMTTGKVIAQVGHATQLAFRGLDDGRYGRWAGGGYRIDVSYGDIRGSVATRDPDVIVTDAGFTEVRPGTRTCCAWLEDEPVTLVSLG